VNKKEKRRLLSLSEADFIAQINFVIFNVDHSPGDQLTDFVRERGTLKERKEARQFSDADVQELNKAVLAQCLDITMERVELEVRKHDRVSPELSTLLGGVVQKCSYFLDEDVLVRTEQWQKEVARKNAH